MPYARNIAFTILIKISGRLREFNFRKRTATLYDVDTNDERGERYFFKAELLQERWVISGLDLPAWLRQEETAIVQALVDQERAHLPA